MFLKRIYRKIISIFFIKKINKQIKHKIVHLMFNDKFNIGIVNFINKNFNSQEHIILCKRFFSNMGFPDGDNVEEVSEYGKFDLYKAKKIIVHGIFDDEIIDFFYKNQHLLKKSYWSIWGGDLYEAKNTTADNFVRENFAGILTFWDKSVYQKKYGNNPKFFNCVVPGDQADLELDLSKERKAHEGLYIQINNSADKSTIEMLKILRKFKDENIKIRTILSYGDLKFKDEIIETGKSIFGDKFEYLDTYMSFDKYVEHLCENDILILNQDRQQGLGNALISLTHGVKVFIKSNQTPYSVFNTLGVKVFDSLKINSNTFYEFKSSAFDKESNKSIVINKIRSNEEAKENWQKVFDDNC